MDLQGPGLCGDIVTFTQRPVLLEPTSPFLLRMVLSSLASPLRWSGPTPDWSDDGRSCVPYLSCISSLHDGQAPRLSELKLEHSNQDRMHLMMKLNDIMKLAEEI